MIWSIKKINTARYHLVQYGLLFSIALKDVDKVDTVDDVEKDSPAYSSIILTYLAGVSPYQSC
jgi:hypothetical protein